MSQHGCPERLSNRSKGFQEEAGTQQTMEVLVETLTGTAFEMTVSPSDTIFAIKSKIFRVEGIPVSQQHLLYNLKELEDWSSLGEHSIGDGARLRLVLGMRGGPISTRRLPPPPAAEPWRDIERLLDADREEGEWGGSGCKVTVLVFRDGERVNMLRVRENHDGTYSPVDHNKYSSSLTQLVEAEWERGVADRGDRAERSVADRSDRVDRADRVDRSDRVGEDCVRDNAVTMAKMLELRRRMDNLSLARPHHTTTEKVEIQKTRSEETLSVPSLLDDSTDPFKLRTYTPYGEAEDTFAPLYDGNYTRYDYDCTYPDRYTLLPPIGTRADSNQSVQEAVDSERLKLSDALAGSILVKGRRDRDEDGAILEECLDSEECRLRRDSPPLVTKNLAPISAAEYGGACVWRCPCAHSQSSSALHAARAAAPHRPHLADALFSSSTSDLDHLKRNSSRMLPALSRHRNREHLHLSDEGLDRAARARREHSHAERRPRDGDSAPEHTHTPNNPAAPPAQPAPTSTTEPPAPAAAADTLATGAAPRAGDAPPPAPSTAAGGGGGGGSGSGGGAVESKKSRVRCALCRKRLSIATVHSCRCGARFCAAHRYAEVHGCAYDYKAGAATLLRVRNPLVTAPKLPKI